MIIKQRIEDATKNVQTEGRGLCRVLAVGAVVSAAVIGKDKGKEKEVGDERKAG